jgi:hypothetical protein
MKVRLDRIDFIYKPRIGERISRVLFPQSPYRADGGGGPVIAPPTAPSADRVFTHSIEAARYLLNTSQATDLLSLPTRMRMLIKAGKTQGNPLSFQMAASSADLYRRCPILQQVEPFSDSFEAAVWLKDNREEVKKQNGGQDVSLSYTFLALKVGGKVGNFSNRYAMALEYVERRKEFVLSTIAEAYKGLYAAREGRVSRRDLENRLREIWESGIFTTLKDSKRSLHSFDSLSALARVCMSLYRGEIVAKLSSEEKAGFPHFLFGPPHLKKGPVAPDMNYKRPYFYYNSIIFSFKDDPEMWEMIRRQRCQVILKEDSLALRNCVTNREWKVKIDEEGYLLDGEGRRCQIKGKAVNVLQKRSKEEFVFVRFWRLIFKKNRPTGKRMRITEFEEGLDLGREGLKTKARVNHRGVISLTIKGKECCLWSLIMERRLANRKVILSARRRDNQIVVSVFQEKEHVDDFYFDQTFNRFYRVTIDGGEIIRNYVEVANRERSFTYGDLAFYLSDKTVRGEALTVCFGEKGFVRVQNDKTGRAYPAHEILREGRVAGYLLSKRYPLRGSFQITGEIKKATKVLSQGHDRALAYSVFGRMYYLIFPDIVRTLVREGDEIIPEVENSRVVSARVIRNSEMIYNTVVRDENWDLLSVRRVHKNIGEAPSGKFIVEGVHTCKIIIRGRPYEAVKIGRGAFTLGEPVAETFLPRQVSVVVDFDLPRGGEMRRIVFWRPYPKFTYEDRAKAGLAAGLPPLPAEGFRERAKERRKELAQFIANIFYQSDSPQQIVSGLSKFIIEQKLAPQDIAQLIDIVYLLGRSDEVNVEVAATFARVFDILSRLFDNPQIPDELIFNTYYLMYAHQELRDELEAILRSVEKGCRFLAIWDKIE